MRRCALPIVMRALYLVVRSTIINNHSGMVSIEIFSFLEKYDVLCR